jgi:hypothetical protein
MVTEEAGGRNACPRRKAGVPRLYDVPERVLETWATPRAACYFWYVRTVEIKPTRRQLVP